VELVEIKFTLWAVVVKQEFPIVFNAVTYIEELFD
jgi:hypothetical protein